MGISLTRWISCHVGDRLLVEFFVSCRLRVFLGFGVHRMAYPGGSPLGLFGGGLVRSLFCYGFEERGRAVDLAPTFVVRRAP